MKFLVLFILFYKAQIFAQNEKSIYVRAMDIVVADVYSRNPRIKLFYSQKIESSFTHVDLMDYRKKIECDTAGFYFSQINNLKIDTITSKKNFCYKNKLLRSKRKKKFDSEIFMQPFIKINNKTVFLRILVSNGKSGFLYLMFESDGKMEFYVEKFIS